MNITDDEALSFMDRLLEWLRQADLTNFGSRIEVVYVAPGAQHVDKQYIASPPSPLQKARGVDGSEMSKSLPDELATDEAMALWRKAQQAGYVNEHYQPTGSRPEAAILAYEMARILGIEDKWKSLLNQMACKPRYTYHIYIRCTWFLFFLFRIFAGGM